MKAVLCIRVERPTQLEPCREAPLRCNQQWKGFDLRIRCVFSRIWNHYHGRVFPNTFNPMIISTLENAYVYCQRTSGGVFRHTVNPVLNRLLLSGHPLISGHLPKSRKSFPLITVKLTYIRRSRSPFLRCQRIILYCLHLY